MFRRLFIGIVALIVVVVAAAAIAPYFIGRQAEASFKAQVAQFNSAGNGLSLHVDDYQRGFYSSDAAVTLQGTTAQENQVFGVLFGTGTQAQFHIRINHGPIPFADFPGHAEWVPVLYTAEFQGNNLPALSLIGALKPEVRLVQYFDGATVTDATIPEGRFSLGVVGSTWRGGHATIHVNSARDHLTYSGKLLSFDFQYADPESGKMLSGSVKGFSFSGHREKAAHDFWVGHGESSFGGAEVKSGGTDTVNLAAGSGTQDFTETDDGRWLNASMHGEFGGGTILGWQFTNFTSDGSITKLDAAGLRKALDALRQETSGAAMNPSQAAMAALIGGTLGQAIGSDTRAMLSLKVAAPTGTAALDGSLGFAAPAGGTASAASPMQQASGQVTITFARRLVDDFANKVLGQDTQQELDLNLQQMASQGYLTVGSDGTYQCIVALHDGAVTINGKPVPGTGGAAPPMQSAPSPASAGP